MAENYKHLYEQCKKMLEKYQDEIIPGKETGLEPGQIQNKNQEDKKMKEKYYIIRARDAGVFFGHIKERTSDEVTLTDVRRLWYWSGAASLSQLAVDGVSNPSQCKFTVTVPEMTVLGVIEVIPCSEKAADCVKAVHEWRA